MEKPIIIRFNGVKKEFKDRTILDNVSLDIRTGEIFGIIGMSGSGKTTLLNTLIGFYQPEEGDIFYNEGYVQGTGERFSSVFENLRDVRRAFGFAPQLPSYYPRLTAEENLDHFGSLYFLPKDIVERNSEHLLKLTEIYDVRSKLAQNLSGGMKQRLGMACALIHRPYVLILDEPTANLDPVLRKQTWSIVKRINEKGTTVVVASHFLKELEGVCHRIAVLHKGKVVAQGTPNELKDQYTKSHEIILETSPGKYDKMMKQLKKQKNLKISRMLKKDNSLVVYSQNAEETLIKILHSLKKNKEYLLDVDLNKPSLSEVFEELTRNK